MSDKDSSIHLPNSSASKVDTSQTARTPASEGPKSETVRKGIINLFRSDKKKREKSKESTDHVFFPLRRSDSVATSGGLIDPTLMDQWSIRGRNELRVFCKGSIFLYGSNLDRFRGKKSAGIANQILKNDDGNTPIELMIFVAERTYRGLGVVAPVMSDDNKYGNYVIRLELAEREMFCGSLLSEYELKKKVSIKSRIPVVSCGLLIINVSFSKNREGAELGRPKGPMNVSREIIYLYEKEMESREEDHDY